jgi:hypothetical protein
MTRSLLCLIGIALAVSIARPQQGLINRFDLVENDLRLIRPAQPFTPFDCVGRKFAILGYENGTFEAWAYPLKLFRNFELSFFVANSTEPIRGRDIVRFVSVLPEGTVLTFSAQSFTIRALVLTPVSEPGALLLLDIDSTEPLTIAASFLPVLQPMWPAGLGGQYAYWDDGLKAYLISEPTRKNHGYLGSPAAEGISYTPAHMLSDVPNQFTIRIADPAAVRGKFVPIAMAGGKGPRDSVRAVYERLTKNAAQLYLGNVEHYRALRQSTLSATTPVPELNLAFEWAKVAYDNLVVDNPDLGLGMVAGLGASGTSGRPGFGWFFGGDTYINAFSLNSYCAYETVRDAIRFTQKYQRDDGKMPHEISQAAAYIPWFTDYPYAYIHGDTSPFYLTAVYDYYRQTGDGSFVKASWASLRRAYEWSLATDADGDGLMDNKKAGLGAMEYGPLTNIQSDIYASAVWVRAAYVMQFLAEAAGESDYSARAKLQYEKSLKSFRQKFWDGARGQYSYAFDEKGNHVDIVSPWPSVALSWGLGEPDKSVKTLEKLNGSELTTDWGIRSISAKSPYYEPLNYNYGAVWPFLNSWVAAAQYRHRLSLQAYGTLMASVRHSFDNALGKVTEVFSGSQNVWPQEAVSHQGFSSAGIVLPFVRGLLGLEGNAQTKVVTFAPQVPADWDSISVSGYRVGQAEFAFRYQRTGSTISVACAATNAADYKVSVELALPKDVGALHATIDGKAVDYHITEYSSSVGFVVDMVNVTGSTLVLEFEPTAELLPPEVKTSTGDANAGLKIISTRREQDLLTVTVEGIAGRTYTLGVRSAETILSCQGCTLAGERLVIEIPKGNAGEFIRSTFTLKLKGKGR